MATRKRAAKTTAKRAGTRKAPAKKTGTSRGTRALKVAGALVAGTAAAAAAVAYARRGTKSDEPEAGADETGSRRTPAPNASSRR